MINLIPRVKRLDELFGTLKRKAIYCDISGLDERLSLALSSLTLSEDGTPLSLSYGDGDGEGYTLSVGKERIEIRGESVRGAFYAIQTLRQLFVCESVPCVYIEDKPDFAYRGFYHDVTRGRVPTLDTLKALVDKMTYFKMNSLQLYVEHTYPFEECYEIADRWGSVTPEELSELDVYCRERFIDFIPSLSTFGHMYEILKQEKYRHLRVLSDFEETANFRRERMLHHTINPEHRESLELVSSLIGQYVKNFSSEYFNICCDETFDLESAAGDRAGELYVEFVKKIISVVKSHVRVPMMWADILEKHPETISSLPEDTIFLTWDYGANPEKENIERISKMQRRQIVCPGTTTWSRLSEDINNSESNIAKMAEYGYELGAYGVLNTNWGDYGNPCTLELATFGLVWGAEKSWSVGTPIGEDFYRRIEALVYKQEGAVAAIRRAAEVGITTREWNFLFNLYCNRRFGESHPCDAPDAALAAERRDGALALLLELTDTTWGEDSYRRELCIALEGIAVSLELLLSECKTPFGRKTSTAEWLGRYRESWLGSSKESEFQRIEEYFTYLDKGDYTV
ncbi:MAG: family 20 glycosylhydrolase [Clostridia bacterium]|nr:family 20 glycosylhydrolase [Clostridia bacterium]